MSKNLIGANVQLHLALQELEGIKQEFFLQKTVLTSIEDRLVEARLRVEKAQLEAEAHQEERQSAGSLDLEKAEEVAKFAQKLPDLLEKIKDEKPLKYKGILDLDWS